MKAKRRTRHIVAVVFAAILLVALLGALLLDERALLLPYAALQWIYRFFRQFPTTIYWAIAVAVAAGLLLREFIRSWGTEHRYVEAERPAATEGDLARLAHQIAISPKSPFSAGCIASELSELAIRLIAQRRGLTLPQARRLLRSGGWTDDPDVRAFLSLGDDTSGEEVIHRIEQTIAHLEEHSN